MIPRAESTGANPELQVIFLQRHPYASGVSQRRSAMHGRTWKRTKSAFRTVKSKCKINPVNLEIAAWELGPG